MPKIVLLWTDAVVLGLLLLSLGYAWHVRRQPALLATWRRVFANPAAMGASVLLAAAFALAVLDSLHFRPLLEPSASDTRAAGAASAGAPGSAPIYDARTVSVLDALLVRLVPARETTYSAPLAWRGFAKDAVTVDGEVRRDWPRLQGGGAHLTDPERQWGADVVRLTALGAAGGALLAALGYVLFKAALGRSGLPWRAGWAVWAVMALGGGVVVALAQGYHVFGTDRTGNDVLVQALKSVRTAFVIGSLSTLATLPLAVGLGIAAGYFRGWVDEVVQYLYTLLSSIPNVLLIAACVLMMQVFFDKHPEMFETAAERSDLRLFVLCAILGLTGWAGLCRLLRAETMKLRELEYVQAAQAFGVGHWQIMRRHIFPNVVHLMLITTVLDFCALILYEAVLSYVGVGVDPSMSSFGGMINLARSEMSRDPVVWWSFAASFGFMVTLVLAANLLADGVQDAFDPRSRAFRPRLKKSAGLSMLQIDDLQVELDAEPALIRAIDGLSLCIERGQTFALVGESGCGKSMTALALMRLLPEIGRIAGGAVRLDGQDLLDLTEAGMRAVRGRRIGMIFQEPSTSLNPVLTVGEQIIETLHAHTALRGDAARERAIDWLRRVGIPEPERRVDEYPFRMSGGQKQRVMIAMTLAAEPDFIIADEPTTALDVTIQAQILDLLRELQRERGLGLLLITHDLAVVSGMAHQVALMYAGQVVESAPAADFFRAPAHPYAQALLKALPDARRRSEPLAAIPGSVPVLSGTFTGCRFAPRCSQAVAACTSTVPVLHEIGPGRTVRCGRVEPGR